jgi:hypothetical protein
VYEQIVFYHDYECKVNPQQRFLFRPVPLAPCVRLPIRLLHIAQQNIYPGSECVRTSPSGVNVSEVRGCLLSCSSWHWARGLSVKTRQSCSNAKQIIRREADAVLDTALVRGLPTSDGVTAPDEVTGSLGSAGPGLRPASDKPGGRCVSDVTSNAPTVGDGTGEGLAWDEAGRESSASEIEFAMLLRLRGVPGLAGLKPVGWPSKR